MKLIRTNPLSSLSRVTDFDDWFRSPFAGLPGISRFFDWNDAPNNGLMGGTLRTDVFEDNDNYFARFEVPGVKKDDVKIELHERMLTVSVSQNEKGADEESAYAYTRSISVPDSVKPDGIMAKLEDGILTVTLPKSEERKPKTIAIS